MNSRFPVVNTRDFAVTEEVSTVQGQQVRNVMNAHGRNQASIMYLDSRDGMRNHQLPPGGMDAVIVRQHVNRLSSRVG